MLYQSDDIHLIYAGGTFGSHGTPLSPLSAHEFLPVLQNLLNSRLDSRQVILDNDCIKDSSTLTPADFTHFYELIRTAHQQGARRFVLITGTDTLSFLASFLFHAFADSDLSLVITGSMNPLLVADNPAYHIDDTSDAWHNLSDAINVSQTHQGVFVQFCHQTFWADNTQKIDSLNPNAFYGTHVSHPSLTLPTVCPEPFDIIKHHTNTANIKSVFLLPNDTSHIAQELANIDDNTTAVILIAYGAGNLPKSDAIIAELDRLHEQNIPVICTTMCPFHGVSTTYAAGSWQYAHHVWSGGKLSIPAIYGRLLWLAVNNALCSDNW
ncbi:asparaginase domain-containing protein [Moraxella sp. K1664]|uniref:asparaginase domain-containing protein n=1 Tax=Moraxella sp. K1664 TaxID=2780077 RepID=UPI001882E4B5|nr:asparaginase domain-containing protein [Moraxella sp. K1664]MBE9577781.1 asparaginase [Moraxella sp. K1664]